MNDKPWYGDGLRFRCTQCGDCCTGAPGYVWVTNEEIKAMAAERGEADVSRFERKYVRKVGVRKSLKERANGDCVFFDKQTRRCVVYAARPRQCRSWPFWHSNIQSPEAWKETCALCRGSGAGRLYRLPDIERRRAIIRI